MKKILRFFGYISLSFLILMIGFITYALIVSSATKLDESKLVNLDKTITYFSIDNNVISNEVKNKSVTPISNIPDHVKNAFISIEDKRFYKHNGVDFRGIARAVFNNVKSLSFKEGASTISQQLIKNTHLSNDKTINRKINEIALTLKLEKIYSKDEILEKYLNTIYFGCNCYGITSASKYYFNKEPNELSINEGAILAGIIKAPSTYSPIKNIEKCFNRKNIVLKEMLNNGFISNNLYSKLKDEPIKTNVKDQILNKDVIDLANIELEKILNINDRYSKKLNVYTYMDENIQNKINNIINDDTTNTDKSIILLNNKSKIIAYSSTCGEISRQLGSVIKPILVYAPAIEEDVINQLTPILDEETNFNGYKPKNYGNKYYGYVSAKEALSKSLNIPAVKILNSMGVDNALKYLSKTDIKATINDQNLSIALGSLEKGATLSEITSAYSPFMNEGNFYSAKSIYKITDQNGKLLYSDKNENRKIFSEETAYIMNDMLDSCVTNGTAKKLSKLPFNVYAKTGTCGNKNGNTDAYTISYNKDFALGVWFGNRNYSLMENTISGATNPQSISQNVWNNLYENTIYPTKFSCNKVKEIYLDKISYDTEQKIEIASESTPKRYQIKGIFKSSSAPKILSSRFISPSIDNVEISVNYYGNDIRLCLKEYYDAKIYKVIHGKKIEVFDTKNNSNNFTDFDVLPNTIYQYTIVPYFENNGNIIYGEEVILNKIKSPSILDDDWLKMFN